MKTKKKTTASSLLSAVKETWPLARNIFFLVRDGETPELPGLKMVGGDQASKEDRELTAAIMALTNAHNVVTGSNEITVGGQDLMYAAQIFLASIEKLEGETE